MRKLLFAGWVLGLGFFAGRISKGPPAHADCPDAACGDVDSSGLVTITDAVYLLNHLFRGGPPPCGTPIPSGRLLTATGQTLCYDRTGNGIPCDSATDPGQDGFYRAGCPAKGRFIDNGDGTVTDNCTGLMWQKVASRRTFSWRGALEYCEGLDLAGRTDWRLPNIRELESLVDYGLNEPAIDPIFDGEPSSYRSSTTLLWMPDSAWVVHFGVGSAHFSGKQAGTYVRAVRGGL